MANDDSSQSLSSEDDNDDDGNFRSEVSPLPHGGASASDNNTHPNSNSPSILIEARLVQENDHDANDNQGMKELPQAHAEVATSRRTLITISVISVLLGVVAGTVVGIVFASNSSSSSDKNGEGSSDAAFCSGGNSSVFETTQELYNRKIDNGHRMFATLS